MKFNKYGIDIYERRAGFVELKKFDVHSKKDDFVEIVEWHNGEGFDVEISSDLPQRFQLTYGAFDAIKKLIKQLDNE
jgi:hypothetical protein